MSRVRRAVSLAFGLWVATVASQAVVLKPTSFFFELGQRASGDLQSLQELDGDLLTANRYFVPNQTVAQPRLKIVTVCPYKRIGSLKIRASMRQLTAGVFLHQFIQNGYDGTTNETFNVFSETSPTSLDLRTFEFTPPGDPNDYLMPDGTIVFRSQTKRSGPIAVYIFLMGWDEAEVEVTEG